MDIPDLAHLQDARLFNIGGSAVTAGGVLAGAVIIVVAFVLSKLVSRALCRMRERSPQKSTAALYLLEKLVAYGLIILGVISGLSAAGLNLSSLAVFAGAIGIGIGLGLQGVVKEFVSGLFLIFDRMVSVGDYVELEAGVRGAIMEIGPRATRIRTNDNVNIIVPNSAFIEDRVTNWTLKGDTRRIHVPFSVAYGADRGQQNHDRQQQSDLSQQGHGSTFVGASPPITGILGPWICPIPRASVSVATADRLQSATPCRSTGFRC